MGDLLGLTPAAMRLVFAESERLYRETGGNSSEDDIMNGKIGELIAGLRARRSSEGGEA
ncbi:hypothetical protein ACXIUS_03700 [Bosea thiooxidans]|nr:hypothetical protein [Bosea sp. (in: a-proteobacteria)]